MTQAHQAERSRSQLLRDAALTLAAVLLAFAAFDDITTDRATTFTVEWIGLVTCGMCLFVVSWRLLRSESRWLGSISTVALVAAIGAGSTIRPGASPFQLGYLVTSGALLWFLGLVAILAGQARRSVDQRAA